MKRTKYRAKAKRGIDFKAIHKKKIQFTIDSRMERFYRFLPKEELKEMPHNALAVYPVFCCLANVRTHGFFHISQDNVAEYAGVAIETAKRGIKYLESCGLLKSEFRNVEKVRMLFYQVNFYGSEKGDHIVKISEGRSPINAEKDLFQFYNSLVLNGTWANLSLNEKYLYIWLRILAKFDPEIYHDWVGAEEVPYGEELQVFYKEEYSRRVGYNPDG